MSSEPPIQSWMQREKAVRSLLCSSGELIFFFQSNRSHQNTVDRNLLLPPPSNNIRPAVSPPHPAASPSTSLEQILPPRRPKPMMIVEIYILRPVVLGYVLTGSTYYSIIQEYDQKVEMRELVGVLRLLELLDEGTTTLMFCCNMNNGTAHIVEN